MEGKLKVYYDAEFTGLHRNTSLISIGLISESGSSFYAEFTDYDKEQVDDWLQEHVIDNLLFNNDTKIVKLKPVEDDEYNVSMKGDISEVKDILERWFKHELELTKGTENECNQIQIYCDCYAYDWMLFNDLMCKDGLALNLPDYLYYIPVDLSTYLQMRNIDPDINREELICKLMHPYFNLEEYILNQGPFKNVDNKKAAKHNSLWDAIICKLIFEKIISVTNQLMYTDLPSSNNRVYPKEVVENSISEYNKRLEKRSLVPARNPSYMEKQLLINAGLNPDEYLVQYHIKDNVYIADGGSNFKEVTKDLKISDIIFIHIPTCDAVRVSCLNGNAETLGNMHDKDIFDKIYNI